MCQRQERSGLVVAVAASLSPVASGPEKRAEALVAQVVVQQELVLAVERRVLALVAQAVEQGGVAAARGPEKQVV